MEKPFFIPFGPWDKHVVSDDFTYFDVKQNLCVAKISEKICEELKKNANTENVKYLTICIAVYNEEFEEVLKTILSVLNNIEFMKRKAYLADDFKSEAKVLSEFSKIVPIIVPVFDGLAPLSSTARRWLDTSYPDLLNEMENSQPYSALDALHVRVSCNKWWYLANTEAPEIEENNSPGSSQQSSSEKKKPRTLHQSLYEQSFRTKLRSTPFDGDDEEAQNNQNDFFSDYPFISIVEEAEGFDSPLNLRTAEVDYFPIYDETGDLLLRKSPRILPFYMCPILKKTNHRKHNSHQWFFQSICQGLGDNVYYTLLTDCGTTFDEICTAKLLNELILMPDLIGVTARQRVEHPNNYFHPCIDSPFSFLQGDHELGTPACWKCWATFFLSPCPLQVVEFEGSVTINLAMFNLIEALPVLPGPCQLLDWRKMKESKVVEEYFNLLFEGENEKNEVPLLSDDLKAMRLPEIPEAVHEKKEQWTNPNIPVPELDLACSTSSISSDLTEEYIELNDSYAFDLNSKREEEHVETVPESMPGVTIEHIEEGVQLPSLLNFFPNHQASTYQQDEEQPNEDLPAPEGQEFTHTLAQEDHDKYPKRKPHVKQTMVIPRGKDKLSKTPVTMSFSEFLRVNMRLAEDRILSFVSIFSTGYGTKWVLGTSFYYQPEVSWNNLLAQRRRWINGTFAGFLFSFASQRAKSRIIGGMFDSHKPGKNIRLIYGFWSLQIIMLFFLLVSPAVFGAAVYKSLDLLGKSWPSAFAWAIEPFLGPVRAIEILVILYVFIYCGWTIQAYYAPRGKISESLCQLLALYCSVNMIPIYLSIWRTIVFNGVNIPGILVILNLIIPFFISFGEDIRSGIYYVLYLPWLLSLIMMFIVFVPSYSFARLWDTTWGNRLTNKDSSLNESTEEFMKVKNFEFMFFLLICNILLIWAFIAIFSSGYQAIIVVMIICFCPMMIQLILSSFFLFIVRPIRNSIWKQRHAYTERLARQNEAKQRKLLLFKQLREEQEQIAYEEELRRYEEAQAKLHQLYTSPVKITKTHISARHIPMKRAIAATKNHATNHGFHQDEDYLHHERPSESFPQYQEKAHYPPAPPVSPLDLSLPTIFTAPAPLSSISSHSLSSLNYSPSFHVPPAPAPAPAPAAHRSASPRTASRLPPPVFQHDRSNADRSHQHQLQHHQRYHHNHHQHHHDVSPPKVFEH